MGGWLQSVSPWHWLVLGVVLVILEIFSPGVFFLWLGIAAGLVGLVLAVWPGMQHEWQFAANFLPEGRRAVERIGAYLEAAFGQSGV